MTRILPGLTVALLLAVPMPAAAHFRLFTRQPVAMAYYYPAFVYRPAVAVAPVYVYPAPAPVVCVPTPLPFAVPQPAPASPGAEPPLAEPGRLTPQPPAKPPAPPPGKPQVRESGYFDAYAAGAAPIVPTGDGRCSVAFWNLTGQDLVLNVAGRRLTLPRAKSVMLDLDRQFVWQVEGRPAQEQRVAGGETALEIVIRR